MRRLAILLLAGATLTPLAWAAPRTVTLDVPGMTCAACPITVKTALSRVEGVTRVEASFEDREAVVTYDDELTGLEALLQAAAGAGYPASPQE
ncbi:mercury resistance system periplasmic binding protein MerP [Halomonas nitroreducens]|uniref:Periplasmic mercury ion-binding protein n=1 Tax=Halomonas nitroreducens TaxID=447425 RepID=A0A3S0HV38_9GAMM|nr:mercury resistance system periplasmic binding protein MerP [Halomonas nitroreducens]RTR06470.1 mercury resistance system periplasmic binding protein MerP [Halomonas nitroreducens]